MRHYSCVRVWCVLCFVVLFGVGGMTLAQDMAGDSEGGAQDDQAPTGWKTMHYLDVPLTLTVKAGQESVLRFPWAVEPGISSDMVGMLDQPRAIGDTFYLTPASPFDFERFTFLSPESGAIILIDIRSTQDALPVRVIVNDARAEDAAAQVRSESPASAVASDDRAEPDARYSVIELAQFAMQMVYAPAREIRQMPGLTELTIRDPIVVDDLVPGAFVEATQWKEWRTQDNRYLTVLAVQNIGRSPVSLDPTVRRHSRYEIASTPYSSNLAPYGMPGDATTLVIISSVPWNEAITLSER